MIHSPISTSLRNKTSLKIAFIQFRILLSHQNAHQNKIYSLNTATDFCVASAARAMFLAFLTVCSVTSHARHRSHNGMIFSNKASLLLDFSRMFQNVSPCEIM